MAKKNAPIAKPESDVEQVSEHEVNDDDEEEVEVIKTTKSKKVKEPKQVSKPKSKKSKKEKVVDEDEEVDQEVDEIPSKKVKKSPTKKANSDGGPKPKAGNSWKTYVKEMKSKPKYKDLSYKELLKIASAQYKKKTGK